MKRNMSGSGALTDAGFFYRTGAKVLIKLFVRDSSVVLAA
jgi:hypothetical protein